MIDHLEAFLYPDVQVGWNEDVDSCFDLEGNGSSDIDCLYDVAETSCFSPSVIGSIVGRQVNEYGKTGNYHDILLWVFRIYISA